MFVRVKKIGGYEYLYLVKNAREGGRHVQGVVKALGRRDEIEHWGLLDSLIASAARHSRTLLAAPGAAGGLIHGCRRDHRLQSRGGRPALVTTTIAAGPAGQGVCSPALQPRHTDTHFTRHHVDRRTLWWQQPRHYPILISLSVSRHVGLPAPQGFRSYPGGNSCDRREPAGHRWHGPRRFGQSGSGDLPGGSCVLAFVEDRLEFFDSTSKAAVSASALSLRCSSRSSSLFRRRSCFRVTLSVSRGSPRPPIASCFQVSNSVG